REFHRCASRGRSAEVIGRRCTIRFRHPSGSGRSGGYMQYRFEDFVLDADRRERARGGEAIAMGPQGFDVLTYLVQTRDRVVTKDDLTEVVRGGRILSESTLTSQINAVRRAVADTGEVQRLIRTIARKG